MQLFEHQRQMLAFHIEHPNSLDLSEVGVGKTAPAVQWMSQFINEDHKALVVCPNSVTQNWQDEIGKWRTHPTLLSSVILRGSKEKRLELLSTEYAVYIINFEGLRVVYNALATRGFDAMIIDEAHHAKDPRGSKKNPTQAYLCRQLGKRVKYRKALTGTVLTNSLEDLWAICEFVDPAIFNINWWGYRQWFFYDQNQIKCRMESRAGSTFVKLFFQGQLPEETGTELQTHGFEFVIEGVYDFWRANKTEKTIEFGREMVKRSYLKFPKLMPKAGSVERIQKRLSEYAIRFEKREVMKWLPPVLFEKRYVELSDEQRRVYRELKKHFVAELDDSRELAALHILTRVNKLLQVVSGFAYHEDGRPYRFKQNGKLDETKELLSEIGDKQVILWAAFKESVAILNEAFPGAKILAGDDTPGSVAADERVPLCESFNREEFQYIICSTGAAKEGLNILSPYAIFYDRNWKLLEYLQPLGRNDRPGAEKHKNITIFNIIGRETGDERVMASLESKEDLLRTINPRSFKEMM